jgi:hypothetical protein
LRERKTENSPEDITVQVSVRSTGIIDGSLLGFEVAQAGMK